MNNSTVLSLEEELANLRDRMHRDFLAVLNSDQTAIEFVKAYLEGDDNGRQVPQLFSRQVIKRISSIPDEISLKPTMGVPNKIIFGEGLGFIRYIYDARGTQRHFKYESAVMPYLFSESQFYYMLPGHWPEVSRLIEEQRKALNFGS